MPRAFTYEEVRDIFAENNCELLSDTYKNRGDVLQFKCTCGNVEDIKFSLFLQGTRCSNCKSENKSKAHRFDIEYVRDFFEVNACELLELEYKNAGQKLRYMCSCGNESTITFRKFKGGQRCFKCSGSEKLSIDDARKRFSKYGYTLLDKEYVNGKTKLSYICKCGRLSKCSVNNLKRHGGCDHCKGKKMPASKQQRYIADLLGGEFNYPYNKLLLDVAFPYAKTYLECDFSGHWLSIKFNQVGEEEFYERERRRRAFMNYQGWIEVRLISRKDWLLDDEYLKQLLERTMRIARVLDMNLAIDIDEGIVFELDSNAKIRNIDAKERWRL
jgi:hypothetical protein